MKHKQCSSIKHHYKELKKATQLKIRKAYWQYIEDLITPENGRDQKRFWSYIKSLRSDSTNITSIRERGLLHSDPVRKANIINQHFHSVFTAETSTNIPSTEPSNIRMEEISITTNGVQKLLEGLNPNKAVGPDNLPTRVLKKLSYEIAPYLTAIYNKSIKALHKCSPCIQER